MAQRPKPRAFDGGRSSPARADDGRDPGACLAGTLNRRARSAIASLRWRHLALMTSLVASELREGRILARAGTEQR